MVFTLLKVAVAVVAFFCSYVHAGGKIGVLVEVNCETDFVARNEQFQEFAREVALHVAASEPLYVSEDEIPNAPRHCREDMNLVVEGGEW